MDCTVGIDVGSTYTKCVALSANGEIVGRRLAQTGFKLGEVSVRLLNETLADSGLERSDVGYVIATGFGRHQVKDKDAAVTDLTAAARGAKFIFPDTRTVLDIGGDHSITGGIVQSLAKKNSKLTKGNKVSLVHFDAHTDCYENLDHFLGAKKSAAHWASYLVRQGNVDAKTSTQIGIRGNPRTLDWLKPSYDLGYQVITMNEFQKIGQKKSSEMILSRLDDKPVYVTFDLDCLDSSVAPAVANLEPAFRGFSIDEARKLLQSLKGKNIIGGDVACLIPTKDQKNNITSMVAASIMFEIISLISVNLKK